MALLLKVKILRTWLTSAQEEANAWLETNAESIQHAIGISISIHGHAFEHATVAILYILKDGKRIREGDGSVDEPRVFKSDTRNRDEDNFDLCSAPPIDDPDD